MFTNLLLYQIMFIYIFKTVKIIFLSYIFYELLNVEHGNPISNKKSLMKTFWFSIQTSTMINKMNMKSV